MRKAILGVVLALGMILLAVPALSQGISPVAEFDAAAFELPEGLAVDRQGNLYAGMALTGEVKRVTPSGDVSTFAMLPNPAPGFMVGLAFDRQDNLYACLASFNPDTHGVWRVSRDGTTELFAALDPAGMPNGAAFDKHGNLYVSDSFLGQIWKIDAKGGVSVWKADPLLLGLLPPGPPLFMPIGANGMAFDHENGSLYVANTDFGRILRIDVLPDRSAGAVEVFVDDPGLLEGADGIAFDNAGNLYVAVNRQNRLAVISPTGEGSVLAEGGLLDFPASVAFGAGKAKKDLYVTNFALLRFLGIEPGAPLPALLKTPVGVPGRPLP